MASSSWRVLTGADSKSYVSLSGLEGVLKSIRDNGMPKTTDRRGTKRVMDKEMPPDLFTTVTLHMLDGNYTVSCNPPSEAASAFGKDSKPFC